jgi:hypothetical protein
MVFGRGRSWQTCRLQNRGKHVEFKTYICTQGDTHLGEPAEEKKAKSGWEKLPE